jgi:EmrB/QacA subfamily drug resistance transporter
VADLRGRRLVYLGAVAVFTLASVACGLAPNLTVLILGRTVQGLAAGSITVASLALLTAAFDDDRQRTVALGIWAGIAAVGTAVGPPIGGVLVDGPGWRSVFFVNVPVGVGAILLTLAFVAESRDPGDRSFDYLGQILFAVGVGAFAVAIVVAPAWGWLNLPTLGLFAAFGVALVLLVGRERRTDDPMMDLSLFRDRVYSSGLVTIFVFFFTAYGVLLLVTQYFQNIRGYSAIDAGFLTLPYTFGLLIFSPLAGVITKRVGRRIPIMIAVVVEPIAVTFIAIGLGVSLVVLGIALFVAGAANALVLTPITALAVGSASPEMAGMASGILSTQRACGSTTGYAVLGSILALYVGANIGGALEPVVPNPATRSRVAESVEEAANPSAYAAELGPARELVFDERVDEAAVLDAAGDVFVRGMQVALGLSLILLLACAVLGHRVFPHDRPPRPAPAAPDRADA